MITWQLAILAVSIAVLPLSYYLFGHFADGGWLFAKPLGMILCSWCLWTVNTLRIVSFTRTAVIVTVMLVTFVNYLPLIIVKRAGKAYVKKLSKVSYIILREELAFLIMLIGWLILIRRYSLLTPDTEKFMEFGFIQSILRSRYMPFEDMWLSGSPVNYYYGCYYIIAFLIRLCGIDAGNAFTMMRATMAALPFLLTFSLCRQIFLDRTGNINRKALLKKRRLLAQAAGIFAGLAACYGGNGHYFWYGIIRRGFRWGTGGDVQYRYFEPTRYIGYDPDVADKTITEFPAYSTVLGDLHPHFVNLLFVLLSLAILYTWFYKQTGIKKQITENHKSTILKEIAGVSAPHILLMGALTGLFRWTNFWDLPIYFVICSAGVLVGNIFSEERKTHAVVVSFVQIILMWFAGCAAALPFTKYYDQVTNEIGRVVNHSLPYQLFVLWGIPTTVLAVFTLRRLTLYVKVLFIRRKDPSDKIFAQDLFVSLIGICAIGLILIPEFVYVKDIYGIEFQRANTMFKLTIQAYLLLKMCVAYIIFNVLLDEKRIIRLLGIIGMVGIIFSTTYILFAVNERYIRSTAYGIPQGADSRRLFIERSVPDDAGGIAWLEKNACQIETQYNEPLRPVVLEAAGSSYSNDSRISMTTGLPTVLGWLAHEWQWRYNVDYLNTRERDIWNIYCAQYPEMAIDLLSQYKIRYIYVGNIERERYPYINDTLIRSLGTVVYEDENVYIVEFHSE